MIGIFLKYFFGIPFGYSSVIGRLKEGDWTGFGAWAGYHWL